MPKKKIYNIPKKEESVVPKKEEHVPAPKYILKVNVTKKYKKGSEMPEEEVKKLIASGSKIDGWFE